MPTTELDPKTQRRVEAVATNSRNWLKLDYEMINAALDIEINPEMSPIRIRKAVEMRLQQMTKRERSVIPVVVWSYLDGLDVTGLGQFHQYNPTTPPEGSENRSGWFSVAKQPPDVAYLIPRKSSPEKFMKSLRSKERFRLWEKLNKPNIVHGPDRVIVQCPVLTDLTAAFVERVFESF